MPDPPTTSPLSDQEQIAVELLSKRWGVALSHDQVTMYLDNFRQKQTTLDEIPDILEMSPEKRAALLCHLNLSEGGNTLEELAQQHIIGIYGQIVFGYDLIEDFETYWRYEPTIEKILELSKDQSQVASRFIKDFGSSEYDAALSQHKEPFLQQLSEWQSTEPTAETVEHVLDMYQDSLGIFERGFPLLLGLKRILDGEDPSVESLQRLRASRVRSELTNVEDHPNSVYFDLIVSQFDDTIRNGISHGDIVHDPLNERLTIPNRNVKYSYGQFIDIARRNFSNAVFVTGMFQSLVQWQHLIQTQDDLTRDLLPV